MVKENTKMFDLSAKSTINCRGKLIDVSTPQVMGILNLTPDSFYDGGKYVELETIKARIEQIASEGATMLDVGAYSSRPGATHISVNQELDRLVPVLSLLAQEYPDLIVSLDTFRAEIAEQAITEYSVAIINDISAGNMDTAMFKTIAKLGVPYCMMHMQGTPQTMQKNPVYSNLMGEIISFFAERIEKLKLLGVKDIIVDPGFGFGKNIDHNYELLAKLEHLEIIDLPVLIGISRKSMIYKYLNTTAEYALNGTTALHMIALQKGAKILRVHDVKEAVQTVELFKKINNQIIN